MDLKQIKELMAAMDRAGIKKMTIKQKGGDELHLEKQDEAAAHHPAPPPFFPPVYAHPHHPPVKEVEIPQKGSKGESSAVPPAPSEKSGKYITSPLVGTFYTAPSPEDPIFVKVGDRVTENTVVCIIEAMKVMNEVKAGCSGTVAELLIDNAHPVEFGTKLFRIV